MFESPADLDLFFLYFPRNNCTVVSGRYKIGYQKQQNSNGLLPIRAIQAILSRDFVSSLRFGSKQLLSTIYICIYIYIYIYIYIQMLRTKKKWGSMLIHHPGGISIDNFIYIFSQILLLVLGFISLHRHNDITQEFSNLPTLIYLRVISNQLDRYIFCTNTILYYTSTTVFFGLVNIIYH